ncbi:MAG: hypothetical protein AB8I08_01240 [Sandaracinaceae bacterium]
MVRALSVLALLLATTPTVAGAQTCMCVAAQPTWDGAPLTPSAMATLLNSTPLEAEPNAALEANPDGLGPDPFVAEPVTPFESVEVGPFFSSDGALLTSSPRVTRPTRSSPGEVLWCASPDDPRCSGRDVPQERGPQTGDASHGAAPGSLHSPSLDAHASGTLPLGPVVGGPRPARAGRLDRPPQR